VIYGCVHTDFSLGLVTTYTAGRIDRVTTFVGVQIDSVTTVMLV